MRAALARVAPQVEEAAADAERGGRFPSAVIAALHRESLFRLWIPRGLDGDELDLPSSLAVFEAAARLDGSAGWLVMIGVGGGLFAAHLAPEAAREVFGRPDALIAGSGVPRGVATPAGEGFRVSGLWPYASGAHHATWITANCRIEPTGAPARADEAPAIRAMAFPASDVEILDTWHVSGMRATGSHDFVVRDAYVPERLSFDVFGPPHEDGPLYRFPFGSIAELSFASVALGITRHAIDAFARLSEERSPGPDGVDDLLIQAEGTLRAVREAFFEQASETWRTVVAGDVPDEAARGRVHTAAVRATAESARVVESLYLAGGMAPLFLVSDLGRCWRDIHAVTQHAALRT